MGFLTRLLGKLRGETRERFPADRPWVSLVSSNLSACRYMTERRTGRGYLQIRFHSGTTYEYAGVPLEVYTGLLAAPSKGKYHHKHIRMSYPYRRL